MEEQYSAFVGMFDHKLGHICFAPRKQCEVFLGTSKILAVLPLLRSTSYTSLYRGESFGTKTLRTDPHSRKEWNEPCV